MLTINVWKHTKGKNKGNLKGPIFAAITRGNVGHVNLGLSVEGDMDELNKLKATYKRLNPFFSSTYVPVKINSVLSGEKPYKLKEELVEYSRKEKHSLEFTHSYWPEYKPRIVDELGALFVKSHGVKPAFQSQLHDMRAESPDILVNGKLQDPIIHHSKTHARLSKAIQDLKKKIFELDMENNNLKITKNNLGCIIKEQEADIEKVNNEVSNLENQLSLLAEKPETDPNNEKFEELNGLLTYLDEIVTSIDADLAKSLQKSIAKKNDELDDKFNTFLINKHQYIATVEKILANQDEVEKLSDELEVLENQIHTLAVTEGKNPDFAISVPTDTRLKYALDSKLILDEMARQQSDTQLKYSLRHFNCAVAIKNAVIAGISPELKQAMKELGAQDKFFKSSIEAPMTVMKWAVQLNSYLAELNYRAEKELDNHALLVMA